jgi:hypothetical protein
MVRIVAKQFLYFIERGATKPFVVEDDNGLKWVVKTLGNPFGAQAVFNEYIAGSLAGMIDLPWPRPSLIDLSPKIIKTLHDNDLKATSSIAVGWEYIHGLKPVVFPDDLDILDSNFKSGNAQYVHNIFPDPTILQSFYGKSIFDNWILLLHDTKYDTLHLLPDGRPIFLDATFAFGYVDQEWDKGKLIWSDTALNLELSPYLSGIVVNIANYDVWIRRIKGVTQEKIDALLDAVPKEWKVPPDYICALGQFVGSAKELFLPMFQEYLEFLNYAG